MARCPLDLQARQSVAGNQTDVAATRGDHHRLAEQPSQHHGGNPVGIEIMGIDQVDVTLRRQQPGDRPTQRQIEQGRRQRHADFGNRQKARMMHGYAVADFARRNSVQGGRCGEVGGTQGRPGHRGHHASLERTSFQQMSQTILDEYAVYRLA